MKTPFKLLVKLVFLFAGLVGIGMISLILWFNPNDYREEVTDLIKTGTGLEIIFEENFQLSLFPSFGVKLGSIHLKDQADNGNEIFARVGKAQINVKLLPLLSRELEIKEILIEALQLHLIHDKNGEANWEKLLVSSEPEETVNTDSSTDFLANLYIGKVSIIDAQISWEDQQAHQHVFLNNLQLTIEDIQPDQPLKFDSSFQLKSSELPEKVSISFQGAAGIHDDQLVLNDLALTLDESTIRGNIKINNFSQPKYLFDLELDSLDIDRYLSSSLEKATQKAAKSESVPNAETESSFEFLQTLQVEGSIKAGTLKAMEVQIENLQTTLQAKNGLLQINPLQAKLYGGELTSTIILDLREGGENLNVAPLSFSFSEGKISGQIHGQQVFTETRIQGSLTMPPLNPQQWLSTLGQDVPIFQDTNALTSATANLSFTFQSNEFKIENLSLQIDESTAQATVYISNLDENPHYQFQFELDSIDLDRYQLVEKKTEEATAPTTPFELPLEMLRSFQVEGEIKIGQTRVSNLQMSDLFLQWKAQDGLMEITPSARLYGGSFSSSMTLDLQDGADKQNKWSVVLEGLQIQPILQDLGQQNGPHTVHWQGSISAYLDGALNLVDQTFQIDNLEFKTPQINAFLQAKGRQLLTEPEIQGNLKILPLDLKQLLSELDLTVPVTTDKRALTDVSADFSFIVRSYNLELNELLVKLDDSTLTGQAKILDFNTPAYVVQLELDTLDVDRYLPPTTEKIKNEKHLPMEQDPNVNAGIHSDNDFGSPPEFLRTLQLTGDLKIGKLGVANIQTSNLQTKIEAKGGLIELEIDADLDSMLEKKLQQDQFHLHLKGNLNVAEQVLQMNSISLSNTKAKVSGQLSGKQLFNQPVIQGKLEIPTFHPQELFSSLDLETLSTADQNALSTASAELSFLFNMQSLELDVVHLKVDESTARGKFQIKDYDSPQYVFQLHLDTIDIDRYVPPQEKEKNTKKRAVPEESTIALPLETLRALALNGEIQIDRLKAANAKISDLIVQLNAQNGILEVSSAQAQLYGGNVSSTIAFDLNNQKTPKNQFQLVIENLQLKPLLADLQIEPQWEGQLKAQLDGALDLEKQTFQISQMTASAFGIEIFGKAQGTGLFKEPKITGKLKIPSLNPKEVLKNFGQAVPLTTSPDVLNSFQIDLPFAIETNRISIQSGLLKLDNTTAKITAEVLADSVENGLNYRFDLALDTINIDHYLPPKQEKQPAVTSETPFELPLDMLRSLQFKGTISLDQITANDLHFSDLKTTLSAQSGVFHINPLQMKLYEGTLYSELVLDFRENVQSKNHFELSLNGVQVGSLYQDLTGEKLLRGKIDLKSSGALDLISRTFQIQSMEGELLGAKVSTKATGKEIFTEPEIAGNINLSLNPKQFLTALGQLSLQTNDADALTSLSGNFDFALNTHDLNLRNIQLKLDKSTLQGNFSLTNFTNPAYLFHLELDTIDVSSYLPSETHQKTEPPSEFQLPLDMLRSLQLEGDIKIGRIEVAPFQISDIFAKVESGDNQIQIKPLQAKFYDGTFDSKMIFDLKEELPRNNKIEITLREVNSQSLIQDLTGNRVQPQKVNLQLSGALDLVSQGLVLDQFDTSILGVNTSVQMKGQHIFTNPEMDGTLKVSSFNPKKLLAALGQPAPKTSDANALTSSSAKFSFALKSDRLNLQPLVVKLDESTAKANVHIQNFVDPQTTFHLDVNYIDLDRYLPPASKQKRSVATKQTDDQTYSLESTGEILNQSAQELGQGLNSLWELVKFLFVPVDKTLPPKAIPTGRSFSRKKTSPTSTKTAISKDTEVPLFQKLQLAGDVAVGKMKAGNVTASNLTAKINSNKGLLHVEPFQANLYGGALSASVILNTRGTINDPSKSEINSVRNELALTLKDVETGPLIKDFSGDDLLFGKVNFNAAINYLGLNPEKIRETLNGHMQLAITDGGIKGVSLTKKLKDFAGQFSEKPLGTTQVDEDELVEIKGSTQITNGLFSNKDLSIKLPLLRLNGHGQLHAATERIAYLLKTSIVPSVQGQSGAENAALLGLTIPVRITGSLQNISYQLDIGEMLPDLRLEKGIEVTGKLVENVGEGIEETGNVIHGVGKEIGAEVDKNVKVLEEGAKTVGKEVGLDKGMDALNEGAKVTGETIDKGIEILDQSTKTAGETIGKGLQEIGKGAEGIGNMLENIFQDKKTD